MTLGPRCPNGAKRVPFGRTQWKIGRPFQCSPCETPLVIPKSNAAMRLGVDNMLTKPMRHETLVDAIKKSLAALDALPKQDLLTFTNRER